MKLPKKDMYDKPGDWEKAHTRALERKFEQDIKEDTVARIDVFAVALPETHLPTNGSEFAIDAAPDLARKLGSTFGSPSGPGLCKLPNIATPYGANTVIGIKK